jgi:hypothetical protein
MCQQLSRAGYMASGGWNVMLHLLIVSINSNFEKNVSALRSVIEVYSEGRRVLPIQLQYYSGIWINPMRAWSAKGPHRLSLEISQKWPDVVSPSKHQGAPGLGKAARFRHS